MKNSRFEDRLTISAVPMLYRIAGGLPMGFAGIFSIYFGIYVAVNPLTSDNDIVLSLVFALFGVLILLFGAYMVSPRWGTITFVRSMGELTMIRREFFRQKTDRYTLSDIKGVVLVSWGPDSYRMETAIPKDKVELIMNGGSSTGVQAGTRMLITSGSTNSQRKNADAIAAFLGFLPQQETL